MVTKDEFLKWLNWEQLKKMAFARAHEAPISGTFFYIRIKKHNKVNMRFVGGLDVSRA